MLKLLGLGAAGALAPWSGCRRDEADDALTLWEIWSTAPGQPMAVMVDEFRRTHPQIPLRPGEVATNNLKAKLVAAAQSRALPDVFLINSAWVKDLGAGENLVDLSALARRDGLDLERMLRPVDFRRCRSGDSAHCLPAASASGSSMLFINQRLLERAGAPVDLRIRDWETLVEMSRDLVARVNRGGDLETIALDPFMGPGMVIHSSLAAGIGAPTTSADGRQALLLTDGSLRAARALDDYVHRVYGAFGGYRALARWRFRFAGQPRVPAFSSLPYDRQIFAISSAGSLSLYRRMAGTGPLRVSVQPVPGLDRLHGGLASHTWAYAVSRMSSRPEEAWQLARFLTLEEEGVGRFCREFVRPSPLLGTLDAEYYRTVGPVWDGVKEAVSLDLEYPASAEDEFLRFHFYTVPMRRMQGESIEQILADVQIRYQGYLDGKLPGVS